MRLRAGVRQRAQHRSGFDSATGTYKPISLQYNEYTATGANVRAESIAGDLIETEIETPYGMVQGSEKENRSYYGESTVATNLSDLNLILDTAAMVPENVKTSSRWMSPTR